MTPPIEEIARGLTEAQMRVFARMKVREPHPAMPDYWAVEFYGGDVSGGDVQELVNMGLVTLPISTGGRGSPTYHGQIHPLGLALRTHLQSRQP